MPLLPHPYRSGCYPLLNARLRARFFSPCTPALKNYVRLGHLGRRILSVKSVNTQTGLFRVC